MSRNAIRLLGIGCLTLAIITVAVWFLSDWRRSANTQPNSNSQQSHSPVRSSDAAVRLSRQARENLGLVSKPLQTTNFWRTIEIPGVVMERPGMSDQGVVSPVEGVVSQIHRFPGDLVKPGAALFTIRLMSESLHNLQMELFKATQEIDIARQQLDRLADAAERGAIPRSRIIDIENQIQRLQVTVEAHHQGLQARGLSKEIIATAAAGKFVTEITVRTPPLPATTQGHSSAGGHQGHDSPSFEIHALHAELGQQVEAGQSLAQLADHCALFVEGRAFKDDIPLVQQATRQGWGVDIDFGLQAEAHWPPLPAGLPIHHIANTVDSETRTFAFYLLLENQFREYVAADGETRRLWRFRPGSRVRLRVPAERLDDVFVLPRDAVVREGPETYVFRQNGDLFDRRAVRVLYEDRLYAVLANDGSIRSGFYIAQSGAESLNRILKSQSTAGTPANYHVHADGTVHEAH